MSLVGQLAVYWFNHTGEIYECARYITFQLWGRGIPYYLRLHCDGESVRFSWIHTWVRRQLPLLLSYSGFVLNYDTYPISVTSQTINDLAIHSE